MGETNTLDKDYFSIEYINQMYEQLKNKVHLPQSRKDVTPIINKITNLPVKEINDATIHQVDDSGIYIHYSDEIALPSKAFFSQENFLPFEITLPSINQLDNYSLQFLKWLKTAEANNHYLLFFEISSKVFYIKHFLQLLTSWYHHHKVKKKILLIIPETTNHLYSSAFSPLITKAGPNVTQVNSIAKKWQNYGFSEKAILITTCFLHGLSLHQFRQVVLNLLKLKDKLEEQDKTERKLLGNHTAKWEKNYDQILRECHLTTLRFAGQPAKIGFKNPNDSEIYTHYIEEEYPIFLQEFFELLIFAVFPQLIKEYQEVFNAVIAMHAHLAENHKDYRQNMRPVDLMVSYITEENNIEKRQELAASLINEMLLHEELKHHARYTYQLISKSLPEQALLPVTIAASSCGQSIDFCITTWCELLQTEDKTLKEKVFKDLINSALRNKSQLFGYIEKINMIQLQIDLSDQHLHSYHMSLYQAFLIYFLFENAKKPQVPQQGDNLPEDLLLAQYLAFDLSTNNVLEIVLQDVLKVELPAVTQHNLSYGLQALIFEEWYYNLHVVSGKDFQMHYPELVDIYLKKISEIPELKVIFNKKNLIKSWQYLMQELLEFAATLPHNQYQELTALNTKRKIMITLINKFRNL